MSIFKAIDDFSENGSVRTLADGDAIRVIKSELIFQQERKTIQDLKKLIKMHRIEVLRNFRYRTNDNIYHDYFVENLEEMFHHRTLIISIVYKSKYAAYHAKNTIDLSNKLEFHETQISLIAFEPVISDEESNRDPPCTFPLHKNDKFRFNQRETLLFLNREYKEELRS